MPFNKIHVPHSLPVESCHAINEVLHASLVETCGVNPDDHFCLISRYSAGDTIFHPTFLGDRDPKSTIVIEIALLAGRSNDQKEALYSNVRNHLRKIGVDPNNLIIFLIENKPIDWSFSSAGSVKSVLGL
ncbi:hypothetical protein HNQ36_005172 [Afipia massiliensis]|uniref:Tautomerase family protein n=1 Tax=Afipia massiliensis TaxID=211460 RepID=A0A840NBY3_9BRAD|nr:hypothetical protein [Afipia massiliensis]